MKMISIKVLLQTVSCVGVVFGSCNIINPEEEIPAYIAVDSVGVYTDLLTQGSATSNIVDAWVTVDGEFLCGYPLGTNVPVLYHGKHKVTLRAGVLLNGIEGTRVPYGVFGSYDTLIDLQPGVIYNLFPRVTYLSSTSFPLNENFDNNSLRFSTPITSASIIVEPNTFDGNCGRVILNPAYSSFECTSIDSFDLPGGTKATYIEIDYKCDAEFSVGVKANTTLGPLDFPLLIVRTTPSWKKIYVNLTSITNQAQGATGWKIYLKASLGENETTDTLRFDNIKLVY